LENHLKSLVSVDFFTVPTLRFQLLYVFLVLAHERRKVIHFNVTDSPSAGWTAQQLTEAFPYGHSLGGDFVLTDVIAVGSAAHFDQHVSALTAGRRSRASTLRA
jgi:hypothetical protein